MYLTPVYREGATFWYLLGPSGALLLLGLSAALLLLEPSEVLLLLWPSGALLKPSGPYSYWGSLGSYSY